MAYIYLLELHDLIDDKIATLEYQRRQAASEGRDNDASYMAGRLLALSEIDGFLVEHCDPSLPRKILLAYRQKRAKQPSRTSEKSECSPRGS